MCVYVFFTDHMTEVWSFRTKQNNSELNNFEFEEKICWQVKCFSIILQSMHVMKLKTACEIQNKNLQKL